MITPASAMKPHVGGLPQTRFAGETFRQYMPATGLDLFAQLCSKAQPLPVPTSPEYPPSKVFSVTHPKTQRTLHLQQWARHGERVEDQPEQAPVVLLVHGLGGNARWQAPLANEILNSQNCISNRALVYSIHLPRTAKTHYAEGRIDDIQDLVGEVQEAINYLSLRHGNSVYAVGTSLGGLLLTEIAADPPPELSGVSLISPAYRPLVSKADKAQVVAARVLKRVGLLGLVSKRIKRHETEEQKSNQENIPEGLSPLQEQVAREKNETPNLDLTPESYLQVVDLMKRATNQLVQNIRIPVQVFISEADDTIDPETMKEASHQLPNQPYKDVTIYEDGEHDLIVSKRLGQMARDINERLENILYTAD